MVLLTVLAVVNGFEIPHEKVLNLQDGVKYRGIFVFILAYFLAKLLARKNCRCAFHVMFTQIVILFFCYTIAGYSNKYYGNVSIKLNE